jgi:Mg-chelatase subunit ChlD
MLVLVLLMGFGFIATAAFSVDVAYMQLVKSELRSANDAAAKAAAEELARSQDRSSATQKGIRIAGLNTVANQPYLLSADDFVYGNAKPGNDNKFVFSPDATPFNSVRVNGRQKSQSASGSIRLFFGKAMGREDFTPAETSTVTFLERDIVLVIDRSGSMLDGNKIGGLRSAINVFINILRQSPTEERVGLATYSTFASADLPISVDLTTLKNVVDQLPVAGLTNISGGIDSGRSLFSNARSRDFTERTMVLLTDGIQNVGRPAASAARDAVQDGIIIHTITFGRDADQRRMREVANIGGGRFYHADNNRELREVFAEIATTFTTIMTE